MRRRANHLVDYLRTASTLPKKIQELAMLITARAMDCQFIWNAHAARGRREGLSDALVDALQQARPTTLAHQMKPRWSTMAQIFTTHKVQSGDISSCAGPVRRPGPDRVDYPDGLLCAASLQRQRIRDRPSSTTDSLCSQISVLLAIWAASA